MAEDEWEMAAVFPVCCAADLTPEIMNRFLNEVVGVAIPEQWHVFVDSLDKTYDSPPARPLTEPSSPLSPFKGKSPLECHLLLKQLQQSRTIEPYIDYQYFVIMDERSMTDGTCLLVVCDESNDPQPRTVRAVFEMATTALPSVSVGNTAFEEDQEEAALSRDGVLGNDRVQ